MQHFGMIQAYVAFEKWNYLRFLRREWVSCQLMIYKMKVYEITSYWNYWLISFHENWIERVAYFWWIRFKSTMGALTVKKYWISYGTFWVPFPRKFLFWLALTRRRTLIVNPLIMIEFRPLRCIFLYFATRKKERRRLKRRTRREMREWVRGSCRKWCWKIYGCFDETGFERITMWRSFVCIASAWNQKCFDNLYIDWWLI